MRSIVLVSVFAFITLTLLSFDHAWMHPEEFVTKDYILQTGKTLNSADISRGLNWKAFEYAPRLTRPLSSYFDILDTKFRSWLWQFVSPHPSLSLTWIFSLILSPWLLYKVLRNLQIGRTLSSLSVALYLMSPGFLSLVVMRFRPAKPMSNFAIILCLYLVTKLIPPMGEEVDPKKHTRVNKNRGFLLLCGVMFCSFFFDETVWLVYLMIPILFSQIFTDPKRIFLYGCLPILMYGFVFFIIPGLVEQAGYGPVQDLLNYMDKQGVGDLSKVGSLMNTFLPNASLLIFDSFGLALLDHKAPLLAKILTVMGIMSVATLMFVSIGRICRRFKDHSFKRDFLKEQLRWGIALGLLLLIHCYLMSVVTEVWGLYWYGAYWSVFFIIWLARILQQVQMRKVLLYLCTIIILLNCGQLFIQTNRAVRKYHFYPCKPEKIKTYFRREVKPYAKILSMPFSSKQIQESISYLREGSKEGPRIFPKEMYWAAIEMDPKTYRFTSHSLLQRYKDKLYYRVERLEEEL